MFTYRGAKYVEAEVQKEAAGRGWPDDPRLDATFWKNNGLVFWIYVVCTSKEGKNLPVRGRQIKGRLPSELASEIKDPEILSKIDAAVEQGVCWYCKLENKGWRPRDYRGNKTVNQVQSVLDFIQAGLNQNSVNGSRILFAKVETGKLG